MSDELGKAQALLASMAGRSDANAIREIAEIASRAKRNAAGWGRLRLEALRWLGDFLNRHGRRQGRPSKKTSDAEVYSLADLGIDYHLSADAKAVARIGDEDFESYLAVEPEPTLAGLLRFAGDDGDHGDDQDKWESRRLPFDIRPDRKSSEWYTPPVVFESMEAEFDVDVASPGSSIVHWLPARRHITKRENGLVKPWSGFVWMNAPYGLPEIIEWIDRFIQHGDGVALVSDWTSTRWFHRLVRQSEYVLFTATKLRFLPDRGTNPTMGATLCSIGTTGEQALRNAERNGLGVLLRRP